MSGGCFFFFFFCKVEARGPGTSEAAASGCHHPRPSVSSGAEPAGQQRLAAISPIPLSLQVRSHGPAGLGHRGPQSPPSDQDTAAFMPPRTYAEARGAQAVTYRPLADAHQKGSSPSLWATTALHALGTGLWPRLRRPGAGSPRVLHCGLAASQAGREDELGAGRPRDTPPAAGSGLAPPLPACFSSPAPPPRLRGPDYTLPLGSRSASGLRARTRTRTCSGVLTAPAEEKEGVSREWAARRLVRAVIMSNLGSEAEREPLLGPGSPGSR